MKYIIIFIEYFFFGIIMDRFHLTSLLKNDLGQFHWIYDKQIFMKTAINVDAHKLYGSSQHDMYSSYRICRIHYSLSFLIRMITLSTLRIVSLDI